MKKTTFWRKDSSPKPHLNFVISDPDVDGEMLIVNMTSVHDTGREDLSCELYPGDHHCITLKSYIRYKDPLVLNSFELVKAKFSGLYEFENEISDDVLMRIQEGARKSLALPEKFKSFFDYF